MKPIVSAPLSAPSDPLYIVVIMHVLRVFAAISMAALCVFLFISLWLGINEFFVRWDILLNNLNGLSKN